jgi:hypothetical protein
MEVFYIAIAEIYREVLLLNIEIVFGLSSKFIILQDVLYKFKARPQSWEYGRIFCKIESCRRLSKGF